MEEGPLLLPVIVAGDDMPNPNGLIGACAWAVVVVVVVVLAAVGMVEDGCWDIGGPGRG